MAHNRGGIEDAAVAEEDEDESDSTEDEDGRYSDEDFQDAVDTSNEQADTTLPDHPTVEIDGESAILLYPGVPTKCCHSGCSFVSNATGTVVATSIIRHLHVKHKQTLKRVWKCSKCGVVLGGYKMRNHPCSGDTGEGSSQTNAAVAPVSTPVQNRLAALRRLSISVTPSISIQPSTPRRQSLDSTRSEMRSIASSAPRPPTQSASQPTTTPTRNISFACKWIEGFRLCTTIMQLEETLERCSAEWVNKDDSASEGDANRPERTERTNTRRTQSRQQQRIRKRKKANSKAASRIQKLFNQYPRRAVREVFGEDSPPFNGETDNATSFLQDTYQREIPSAEERLTARETLDSCQWNIPNEFDSDILSVPPRKEEILRKLLNASNTAPGGDRIEYLHIKKLDPNCSLLEVIYELVWKLGIPRQWKTAKTILIHKKGNTDEMSNFRPISLLSTIYKLFSGVLTSKLTQVAQNNKWLSAEQKGFLPGVRGIQEHTQLLQTVVDNAQRNKTGFSITWLDLTNAFGSLPHAFLQELFSSLPIPARLREILNDIYTENVSNFLVNGTSIPIHPTAGVRQGDALSAIVFNLAAEALVRAAKSSVNDGVSVFGVQVKVTAYADDMTLVSNSWKSQQKVLDEVVRIAEALGLKFNTSKCVNFSMSKGQTCRSNLILNDLQLRSLGENEHEEYLGTPIGARLRFRPATSIPQKLHLLADSLLAPWQKLEIYRAYLIPSLAHHLASGKVEKLFLRQLEQRCKNFLRYITNQHHASLNEFFYADRRVGGLGTMPLHKDADIWTLARATQLLDSSDPIIRHICRQQLEETIIEKYKDVVQQPLPISEFLSGSMTNGLFEVRYGGGRQNLWTRARRAAIYTKVQIDVSSDETPTFLVADDISVVSTKAVRGLRTVLRQRYTTALLNAKFQSHCPKGLALDTTTKDIARMTSSRTSLNFKDWHYLFRGRLGLLPLRGCPGSQSSNKMCRHCGQYKETTHHVASGCNHNLVLTRARHNAVQNILASALRKQGHTLTIDCRFPGTELRPDIVVTSVDPPAIIDIAVPYDDTGSLLSAFSQKVDKYIHLGIVYPLIVGSFGAWLPENRDIQRAFGFSDRQWNSIRRQARTAAIQGTTRIISHHLAGSKAAEAEPEEIYISS